MKQRDPPRPTGDECNANARHDLENGDVAVACWYPQMGGYVGACWVIYRQGETDNRCFDVLVWHDGEFPFGGEGSYNPRQEPCRLHHCSAEQFVEFGQAVLKWQADSAREAREDGG